MFSSLVRRAVPRGAVLASASASALGAARGGHAPWSSSAVASSRSSWFAGTETVAARAGARSSAPFAASSVWAAAGAVSDAEMVRTAFGAARVRAFGVEAAASARAGTRSVAGARRAATGVATSLERPKSVAGGPARTAMMTTRRAYYNNSGGVASGRLRYGAPPPASPRFDGEQMLWRVVGANTFIFFLWHAVDPRFMQANFTVSERSVYTGSMHTLVTAAFSHYDFTHYASNMLALYYFGRNVGALMGGTFLLNLYLVGGVVASATHVLWCRYERQRRRRRFRGGGGGGGILQSAGRWMEHRGIGDGFDSAWRHTPPALGASGAVNAVVFLNAALFPARTVYLNFFIPMPNILFAGMFLARDLYGAQMGLGASGTGHAAHLGGAAVGAAAWAALRAGAFRRGGFGRGRFGG